MATTIHPRSEPTPDPDEHRPPSHRADTQLEAEHPALERRVKAAKATVRGLDKVVFGVTATIAVAFLIWGFVDTGSLGAASDKALGWSVTNLGWLFVLTASAFVVFVIYLALGKYGDIPLGNDGEKPEFRTVSWIAMMFSAGMGIGLMFFGVAEPISHFTAPPPGTAGAGTDEALQTAMATTLFHWTLHPWAIYAVLGIAIAYSAFRKGRPQLVSSVFAPLLGERRTQGGAGKVIDILAIFATLFGSAASLGLGALQIGSGLTLVSGIGRLGNGVLVGIITVLTICFILSAVSGIEKGIQWLPNTNMVLALVLAVFVFVVGPTVFILDLVPTAVGSYFGDLAQMSARTDAVGGDAMATWLSGWTVFYWAWWLSWTPFVGMFIARISRGRTIRQFVTGVLLVPSLVSLVWFAVFGGAAIQQQQAADRAGEAGIAGAGSSEGQLFEMLGNLPLPTLTAVLVMVLVAIFFVSGADAASIVMGTLSEHGTIEPSRFTVIFWGVATGAVAAIMLLLGDPENPGEALTGLQNLTILAAVPFVLVMIALCVALMKDLRTDPLIVRRKYGTVAVEHAVVDGVTKHGDDFSLAVEENRTAAERYPHD
ncbi:BCCT family transporter [Nocardioides marmoraquaticus]